jgi:hypothetical protein
MSWRCWAVSASTVSRARIARRQAKALGLRMVQRGNVFELRDDTGQLCLQVLLTV